MEIMQDNQTDLTNLANITSKAESTIFDVAPIELIEEKYRKTFITGFALRFFQREIGMESIPLWKIALAERILNSADYINQVYHNLERQLFGRYSFTKYISEGDTSFHSNGTNDMTGKAGSVTKAEIDGSNEGFNKSKGSNDSTMTVTSTTKGDTTTADLSTVTNNNDTISDSKNDETTTVDQTVTSHDSTIHDGKTTTTDDGKSNNIMKHSDTPQNGLQDVLNGTYLSDASSGDTTNHDENEVISHETGSVDNSTYTIGTNKIDGKRHDTQHTEGLTKDKRDGSIKTTGTNNSTTTNKSNSQSEQTTTGTNHSSSTGTTETTNTGKTTTEEDNSGRHHDKTETESYSLSSEFILRSMPYTEKIFSLFETLFMQIF